MLRRLKNLWSWSNISPYEAGQETGNTIVDAIKHYALQPRAEIVYPVEDAPKVDNPEQALQELIEDNG